MCDSGVAVGTLQLSARLIAHVLRRQVVAFALEKANGKVDACTRLSERGSVSDNLAVMSRGCHMHGNSFHVER